MNEQTTEKKSLDAIGKTIFAFTTVISIILIVLGVVLVIKDHPRSSTDTPDKTKIYSIALGGTKTIDTASGEYYNFELNISSGSAAKHHIDKQRNTYKYNNAKQFNGIQSILNHYCRIRQIVRSSTERQLNIHVRRASKQFILKNKRGQKVTAITEF